MSQSVTVPGRVNLIGEHIDYLGYSVLPMAISRRLTLEYTPCAGARIRVKSDPWGEREFDWTPNLAPYPAGDFGNYAKAAAEMVGKRWGIGRGLDGAVSSTIPAAAGLSSSSALVIATALALLRVNGIAATFDELMEVLPEGEMYVGTRGGGMDHAICLAGRRGCALKIDFDPVRVQAEPVPPYWSFFVAHSLQRAEKSGAAREDFNRRRALAMAGDRLALRHAESERQRVEAAIQAMRRGDLPQFGALLLASHASLRDDLRVSCEGADRVVAACMAAGAAGARIMGGGFGGYVVALCDRQNAPEVLGRIERDYYRGSDFPDRLMQVDAADGVLAA